MKVPGVFFVNSKLQDLMFGELKDHVERAGVGGYISNFSYFDDLTASFELSSSFVDSPCSFLPAVKQIANVASLPGIVGASVGLPGIDSLLFYFIFIMLVLFIFSPIFFFFLIFIANCRLPLWVRLCDRQRGGVRHEQPGRGGLPRRCWFRHQLRREASPHQSDHGRCNLLSPSTIFFFFFFFFFFSSQEITITLIPSLR
jgi:hypothetical protein